MRGALSLKPAPRPSASPDPEGPVQPLDVEEGAEIPLDEEGSRLRFEEEGVTLETEIEGVPIELRIDENGIAVEPLEPED